MRGRSAIVGLDDVLFGERERVERALAGAMEELGRELVEALRDLVFAAGLGARLPYTWKLRTYPETGGSLEPSAYVYSAASAIISFFSPPQRVITPLGGGFAIPVSPVTGRRGKPLTPFEVELRFNQGLEPRRLPSGNIGLFMDLVRARSTRRPGFRQATKGRLAQGRRAEQTLMFVIVRSLRSKPVIKLEGVADRIAGGLQAKFDRRMGAS